MKISSIDIRLCKHPAPVMKDSEMRDGRRSDLEFLVVTMRTDDGLELVNLHCCAAIKNCEFFEVLVPWEYFNFGLKQPLKVEKGHAILPDGPGLGADLDWDFIDRCTFATL